MHSCFSQHTGGMCAENAWKSCKSQSSSNLNRTIKMQKLCKARELNLRDSSHESTSMHTSACEISGTLRSVRHRKNIKDSFPPLVGRGYIVNFEERLLPGLTTWQKRNEHFHWMKGFSPLWPAVVRGWVRWRWRSLRFDVPTMQLNCTSGKDKTRSIEALHIKSQRNISI